MQGYLKGSKTAQKYLNHRHILPFAILMPMPSVWRDPLGILPLAQEQSCHLHAVETNKTVNILKHLLWMLPYKGFVGLSGPSLFLGGMKSHSSKSRLHSGVDTLAQGNHFSTHCQPGVCLFVCLR